MTPELASASELRPATRSEAGHAARPLVSVIVPAHAANGELEECLRALRPFASDDVEIVVVDDTPDHRQAEAPLGAPVRIIPNRGTPGPAGARNCGAEAARGEILFFVDSDVEVTPTAFAALAKALASPQVAAVFGVERSDMRYSNFASQYRNLWMRFSLLKLPSRPGHLHTSCAAIRASAFRRVGGFDERYRLLEDADFGHRLLSGGGVIARDADLAFRHHRYYDLLSLLNADRTRAAAIAAWRLRALMSRARHPAAALTVSASQSLAVLLFGGGLGALAVGGALSQPLAVALGVAGAVLGVALRAEFLLYLRRERGWRFLLRALLFTPLDYVWVLAGALQGVLRWQRMDWGARRA